MACKRPGVRVPLAPLHFKSTISNTEPVVLAAAEGQNEGQAPSVTSDKDLRERYGGLWEGLTDTEIRAQYPVEHSQWLPPGGESTAAVADRAGAAMDRIAETLAPGSLAVVVSHGAALRLGAARLLGLPEDLWGAVGPLANCAWSLLGRRRGRWRLLEHNAGTLPEPVLSDDR